jgi:hypothetical protein
VSREADQTAVTVELAPLTQLLSQPSRPLPQVEKLKEENNSLMEELVAKKMALAELSENHARLKRDLHRRAERDKVWPSAVPITHNASGLLNIPIAKPVLYFQLCSSPGRSLKMAPVPSFRSLG